MLLVMNTVTAWLDSLHDEVIVEVLAYLDSTMVTRLFTENPMAS